MSCYQFTAKSTRRSMLRNSACGFGSLALSGLLAHAEHKTLPLFSDLGEDVFIPSPVKEYPPVHFLRVADVEQR